MGFWDRFRRPAPTKQEPPEQPPSGEVAYSESQIYMGSKLPKYNPDGLIGKKGASIYRKMMTDEQVKAVVKFRRDAITSRTVSFTIPDGIISDAEMAARIEVTEAIVSGMSGSFVDAMNGIMSAVNHGFSITEKVFGEINLDGRTWIGIKALKLRPFDTFTFRTDPYGNIEALIQEIGQSKIDVPMDKIIHYVQNPDVDEHYGESELRAAYRSYYAKDIILRLWNVHLERHASGFLIAKPTAEGGIRPGSQAETDLHNSLINVQAKTAFCLPAGVDLTLQTPATTDAFEKAVAHHNREIAKALLVPNLLGISDAGGAGSFAQSQTQLEAFLWTLDADADRLQEALNEQLFRQIGELNWGDEAWPRIRLSPVSAAMKQAIIGMWAQAVQVGAVIPTDTDAGLIREMLRFPAAGEPLVKGASAPTWGAPPPAPPRPPAAPPEMHVHDGLDSTIIGRSVADVERRPEQVAVMERAVKRVDFTAIGYKSESVAERGLDAVAAIMDRTIADLLAQAKKLKLPQGGGNIDEITGLEFPASSKARLRKAARAALSDAWVVGEESAWRELRRASMGRARFGTIADNAAAYLEARSFTMAGNLTDVTLSVVLNGLLQGVKNSKSWPDMERDIYTNLANTGVISESEARARLGAEIGVKDPSARLRTTLRTNTFDAINEARMGVFTDPALGGYVQALEYTAILDSRTSAICEELDGKIYPADSPMWEIYSPPNHHNCRSLLIAVTEGDKWSESQPPAVEPSTGFH